MRAEQREQRQRPEDDQQREAALARRDAGPASGRGGGRPGALLRAFFRPGHGYALVDHAANVALAPSPSATPVKGRYARAAAQASRLSPAGRAFAARRSAVTARQRVAAMAAAQLVPSALAPSPTA
jgi:hypothetical protein